MLFNKEEVLGRLRALGFEDNEELTEFVYDNLSKTYVTEAFGSLTLKGFIGVDDSDIYRIVKAYAEYKRALNSSCYEMISIDARDVRKGYITITELIERANKGEKFVIVFRNVDDNDDLQRDLVEFAYSLTGINGIELLDRRNIDLFYSTSSYEDLTGELQYSSHSFIDGKNVINQHK